MPARRPAGEVDDFPPPPRGMRGRAGELRTLARTIVAIAPTRLALVGAGGSGKSMLAAALGHRLRTRFGGRVHWFRVGAWDFRTLTEMLALRFGTSRERRARVRDLLGFLSRDERLIVLDNHEDDRATGALLEALGRSRATFVITARRCLLAGVLVFPVAAPLVTSQAAAFPRVRSLTRALRWNPLALDLADALVATRSLTVRGLEALVARRGVERVRAVEHEDDLPEVGALVDWAWGRLDGPARRLFGVLAHLQGDHADLASLASLARLGDAARPALGALLRWRLVQEPAPGRYALHAVVRHFVAKRTAFDPARLAEHYVALLERAPERAAMEQTHLFAAMDHAHRAGDLDAMLRIERLLARLG